MLEGKREVNGCGKVLLQRRFEKWRRRELGPHKTVGSEAVCSSEPHSLERTLHRTWFARANPSGSLEPTLLEAISLERPIVCSSDPLSETRSLEPPFQFAQTVLTRISSLERTHVRLSEPFQKALRSSEPFIRSS